MSSLEQRVNELELKVASVKTEMDAIKRGVETNNTQTQEMYEAFNNVRGGFRTIEWIGKIAVPLGVVGSFVAAGYVFYKTGVWRAP